jgi:hypothetical protein
MILSVSGLKHRLLQEKSEFIGAAPLCPSTINKAGPFDV